MAGVTSTPMPSPSIKGMIGLSGTFSVVFGLTVIFCPSEGTLMCSYCMEGRMLPLPGFVRRAIFAEYEPEVEYLDVIAWRKSPHAPYLVANARARKAGKAGRPSPTWRPAYPPAGSGYAPQSAWPARAPARGSAEDPRTSGMPAASPHR